MDGESLASPEVLSSLSQALSNLVLGDNEIRAAAERLLTEKWLATQPEQVILALAQLIKQAQDENMRSFAAVLLRRLAFRIVPTDGQTDINERSVSALAGTAPGGSAARAGRSTIYDHLSEDTRFRTERALLKCLADEPVDDVRKKVADTIIDLAVGSMERGRPWPELQTAMFEGTQSSMIGHREVAFRILASVPHLVLDQDVDIVLRVMQGGLKDTQSLEVRHAALKASVAYLTSADPVLRAQAAGLMHSMLESLVGLPHAQLANYLRTLTTMTSITVSSSDSPASDDPTSQTSLASLFRPHLTSLLTFLIPLILTPLPSSQADLSDATPTVGNPNPHQRHGSGHVGAFIFPSTPTASNPHGHAPNGVNSANPKFLFPPPGGVRPFGSLNAAAHQRPYVPTPEDEARDSMRRAALEFLVSLSEARPTMVRECQGWVNGVVRCCLEGMSEVRDEGGEATLRWADTDDPAEDDDDYGYPHVFDESLDRLACAIGGRALLPVALNYIPALLASHDWMQRHAGLMAIAAIAEGTHQAMEAILDQIVALVVPRFQDPHPRVRYAACQCIGQLCTDLEELIQERYHRDIFNGLIPVLRAPEARVQAHASAAIVNFCNGVDGETLQPYLDPIVEGLTMMLNTDSKRYVQEQAITTLAMVADASAEGFRKVSGRYYPTIMPSLVSVMRSATDSEMRLLRCKVMECAGLIAVAVGRELFEPQSKEFAEILLDIQAGLDKSDDETTPQYLMSTWAKVCQALGQAFEPYLQHVMPLVLHSAAVRADMAVVDADSESATEKEGWEVIEVKGKRIEIRMASLDEKCTAFDVLLVMGRVMGQSFAPYLSPSLHLAVPALRFQFHDGVRETAALLIPTLVANAKNTDMVNAEFCSAIFTPIIEGLATELDAGFLASLYACFADSLRSLSSGDPTVAASFLSTDNQHNFLKSTGEQIHSMATRRQTRSARVHGRDWQEEHEDMLLMEEMEGFALDEMQKAIEVFDPNHDLLFAISNVREIHVPQSYDSDSYE